MSASLIQWDYALFEKINSQWTNTWADFFFPLITDLHKSPFFFPIVVPMLLGLFFYKYKKVGFLYFFFLLVAVGASDWAGARVKNHYLRQRPFENTQIHAIQKSPAGSKSFYSNHTSTMFTISTYMTAFFTSMAAPLYAIAGLVAYSRIYNGVHYPSDVIAGAIMGIIWGLAFSSLAKRFQRKKA